MIGVTKPLSQYLLYCLALPVVMVASCGGAGIAFGVYDVLPAEIERQWDFGVILNQYAPGIAGLLVTMVLYTYLR